MRPIWMLLRHRLMRWWRDPTWGVGTVMGQVTALGLVLVVLVPLGIGSYMLGDVLRELFPDATPLRLINGGILLLVPGLTTSRVLFETPLSERIAPYVALPLSPRSLLHGQALLSLPSLYTVVALVLVGPVWGAEVWGALSPGRAFAWLAVALLLTVVVAGHGADLLHVLLGRRPGMGLLGLGVGAAFGVVNAFRGAPVFWDLSRALFGHPGVGAVCTLVVALALHVGVVRTMRARLVVDRGPRRRGDTAA